MKFADRERLLCLSLAAVRTVFCGYRAVHQSITFDESWEYTDFVAGPWARVWSGHPTNHVLFTMFAKISAGALGVSEFSLRLPTVIAAFFLMWGAFEVLRLTTESRALRWAAWIALAFHPLLLDFSVAARGYGMAAALMIWAVYFAMKNRFADGGALIGFAVAANYTVAFPAFGLIVSIAVLIPGNVLDRVKQAARPAGIAVAVVAILCGFPLLRIPKSSLYGATTLDDSLRNLIWTSIHASPSGLPAHGGAPRIPLLEFVAIPLLFGFMAIADVRMFKHQRGSRLTLIPAATFFIAAAALILAHWIAGVPYPYDRTGLPLTVLLGIAWTILANGSPAWLRNAFTLLACALVVQFALQMHTDYFQMWWFDAKSKEAALALKHAVLRSPASDPTAAVLWQNSRSIEFYRATLPIPSLQISSVDHPLDITGLDYYIDNLRLDRGSAAGLKRPDLATLFRDEPSGMILIRQTTAPMNRSAP